MRIKELRDLFDIGVTVVLGDDDISVTGRDFYKDSDFCWIESTYSFDYDTTIEDMVADIKGKKNNGAL